MLDFWYFSMNLNNVYKIYDVLVTLHTPGRRSQEMGEAIELSMDVFLQRGNAIRRQKAEYPNIRNLSKVVFNTGSGRKFSTDAKGYNLNFVDTLHQSVVLTQLKRLRKKQKLDPWAIHQSVAFPKKKADVRLRVAQVSRHPRTRRNVHLKLICDALSAVTSRKMMCSFATIQRMVLLKYVIGDIMEITAL